MKKFIAIVCLLLASLMLLASCAPSTNSPQTTDSSQPIETTAPPVETTEQICVEHEYLETARTDALALKDGAIRYSCSVCGDEYSETVPATKSIKILALGNSFTVDGTNHLWDICKDGGAESVIVGNLYIGNCTLDTHWNNISGSKAAYTFYKNTNGTWKTTENYRIIDALKEEDWDYIVLHQTSGSAGFANTFGRLDDIIGFMNDNKTNANAKVSIVCHADKGTGNAAINKRISEKRAQKVADVLVQNFGISSSRIDFNSLGDTEQPFSKNDMNRVCICIAK